MHEMVYFFMSARSIQYAVVQRTHVEFLCFPVRITLYHSCLYDIRVKQDGTGLRCWKTVDGLCDLKVPTGKAVGLNYAMLNLLLFGSLQSTLFLRMYIRV
jgi:hypothetical protein